MLGLKQFGTPQFYVPQLPQTERPLHKAKDFMSFLNSLQWKADDEEPEPEEKEVTATDYNVSEPTFDWMANGFNTSLNDTESRIGETRFDNLDVDEQQELANQSLLHGGALNFKMPQLNWDLEGPMDGYTPLSSMTPDFYRGHKGSR